MATPRRALALLQHLCASQTTRLLAPAILQYATPSVMLSLPEVFRRTQQAWLRSLPAGALETVLTNAEAEVTGLVLQCLEHPPGYLACESEKGAPQQPQAAAKSSYDSAAPDTADTNLRSSAGQQALAALQEAVYGTAAKSRSLLELVANCTFEQTQLVAALCEAVLQHSILAASNALALLALAAAAGAGRLGAAARTVALRSFATARRADEASWGGLPEAALVDLLTDNNLQVESEVEVFEALAAWVDADRPARLPAFARTFSACVRVSQLDREGLERIDSHLMLNSDPDTLKLVAAAYMACLGMGASGLPALPSRNHFPHPDRHSAGAQTSIDTPAMGVAELFAAEPELAGTPEPAACEGIGCNQPTNGSPHTPSAARHPAQASAAATRCFCDSSYPVAAALSASVDMTSPLQALFASELRISDARSACGPAPAGLRPAQGARARSGAAALACREVVGDSPRLPRQRSLFGPACLPLHAPGGVLERHLQPGPEPSRAIAAVSGSQPVSSAAVLQELLPSNRSGHGLQQPGALLRSVAREMNISPARPRVCAAKVEPKHAQRVLFQAVEQAIDKEGLLSDELRASKRLRFE